MPRAPGTFTAVDAMIILRLCWRTLGSATSGGRSILLSLFSETISRRISQHRAWPVGYGVLSGIICVIVHICADFRIKNIQTWRRPWLPLRIPRIISRLGQPCCHCSVSANKSSMRHASRLRYYYPVRVVHNYLHNNKRSSLFPCSFKIIQVNSTQSSFDSRIEPKTTDQRGKTLRRGK